MKELNTDKVDAFAVCACFQFFRYDALKDDLKDEQTENADFKKTNAQIAEEERLLNKEMRGKNAKIAHLEKDIVTLKEKLKQSGENFKRIKLQVRTVVSPFYCPQT